MTATERPSTDRPVATATMTRRRLVAAGRVAVDLGLPLVVFYALRAAGVELYWALLAGALVSAATAVVPLLRGRRLDGVAAFMTCMMVGSVLVSLVGGGTRFLLARDALLTGVAGVWFIASCWARRPLAYHFSRPLLQGRFRWPTDWDGLWDRSPRFRRMWRTSSVLFGIGTLADAAVRVLMAYTLPPDLVPALATALYLATTVVLITVTSVHYARAGVYDRNSPIYRVVDGVAGAEEPAR